MDYELNDWKIDINTFCVSPQRVNMFAYGYANEIFLWNNSKGYLIKKFERNEGETICKMQFINFQLFVIITDSTMELWSIQSGCLVGIIKACISPNLALNVVKRKNGTSKMEIFFYNKIEQRIEKMNEILPETLLDLLEN